MSDALNLSRQANVPDTGGAFQWLPTADLPRRHSIPSGAATYRVRRVWTVQAVCGMDIPLPTTDVEVELADCRLCTQGMTRRMAEAAESAATR